LNQTFELKIRGEKVLSKLGPGDSFTKAGMQNLSLKSNLNS